MNEVLIGADEESSISDDDRAEELLGEIVQQIVCRCEILSSTYPFRLDPHGDILTFEPVGDCLGRAAYMLSLVLSNLPVLSNSPLKLDETELRKLRHLFQYVSTAALAAEVHGDSWSFGFPRPDGSRFLTKLEQIWSAFEDGKVGPKPDAPRYVKDAGIDVFSARIHSDRQAGFLLAAAQVSTGKDWKNKSVVGQLKSFKRDWFKDRPDTKFIPYMIIPFTVPDSDFRMIVSRLGNVLHRLRIPNRVAEAQSIMEAKCIEDKGMIIEAYDRLSKVVDWLADYQKRARKAERITQKT